MFPSPRRDQRAGSLRRSGSIRSNCSAGPRSRISAVQTRNAAATAPGLRAQARPPGTEFLDAETGCQKSPLRRANAHRDKNPGIEYAEIRAETPYLASRRKRVVCKDWMVVCAVVCEPVSAAIPHWKQGKSAVFGFL